jgi:hypothetical protein
LVKPAEAHAVLSHMFHMPTIETRSPYGDPAGIHDIIRLALHFQQNVSVSPLTSICCLPACATHRLESLRRLVPHAERANTATFLEEVIKYIGVLQSRNSNLERMIRDLQQAPLMGAAGGPDAETIAAAARASQLISQQQQLQQQQGTGALAGLGMPAGMDHMMQQLPQGMQQQAHLLRTGTSGSGSMGAMPGLQDTSAREGVGAAGASPALASNSPAAMLMQQQQQQHQDSAAQSGAAALLAAAGATAAMAAGAGAPATAKPNSSSAVITNSGGAAGPSGAGSAAPAAAAAAAAAAPAAAAAQKPAAVVQVPDMLQSLLPQGLDLQQMLQQALLSTQAQLLAQLQHHNKQTSSGTGAAAAGADAGTGTAASSGGTSGQPATSTAPLSALQQALSAQQPAPANLNSQEQPQQLPVGAAQQQQLLQATAGLLAAVPGLVMPIGSEAEPKQPQQQLLQPAPALNINLQQQAPPPSSAGPAAPPVTAGLQDAANLLAINQIMAQLRANPTAGQPPMAAAGLLGPSGSIGGGEAAGCGSAGRPLSPSAAAGLPGGSPARRAAAAAVAAGAAFSGGDGAASGGAMPSLPNLLAMAPPAGVLEQRSSSVSGDRDDEGSVQAAKKRKMLVL